MLRKKAHCFTIIQLETIVINATLNEQHSIFFPNSLASFSVEKRPTYIVQQRIISTLCKQDNLFTLSKIAIHMLSSMTQIASNLERYVLVSLDAIPRKIKL